mgnify:CR=1 FL=1
MKGPAGTRQEKLLKSEGIQPTKPLWGKVRSADAPSTDAGHPAPLKGRGPPERHLRHLSWPRLGCPSPASGAHRAAAPRAPQTPLERSRGAAVAATAAAVVASEAVAAEAVAAEVAAAADITK